MLWVVCGEVLSVGWYVVRVLCDEWLCGEVLCDGCIVVRG